MNILHIEDDSTDAYLVLHELNKNWKGINYFRVEEIRELDEALKRKWHIILCDFDLRLFDGTVVLGMLRDHKIDTPVIMVSGRDEAYIAALIGSLSAAAYIGKDNLKNLAPAISRALKIAME
jgi:two-component system sensor histidine kinase UhpB